MDILLNKPRAIEIMERYGLDALIATLPENVVYASDYGGHGAFDYRGLQLYVILPREDIEQAAIIVPTSEIPALACHPSWIQDIRIYGSFYAYRPPEPAAPQGIVQRIQEMRESVPRYSDALTALKETLTAKGLSGGRLGVDEMNLPPPLWDRVKSALPKAVIAPAFAMFRETRMIKTPSEINRIRRAFQVTEQALRDAIATIREGIAEFEVYQAFRESVTAQGGNFAFWTSGGGPHSALPGITPSPELKLKKGDIYRFDCGSTWEHAWSDTGRTAIVGEPSPLQRKIYTALVHGVEAALEITRPGTKASELFDTVVSVVREEAVPDYRRHHTGHSIGLEFYEPPLIAPPSDTNVLLPGAADIALEPGMVLNLEAPYYSMGFGGLQIEDTVLVTETGWEAITMNPREIFVR